MIWYTLDLKQDCSTSCFPNSFVYVAKKYHENETKLTQMKLIKKYLIETHFFMKERNGTMLTKDIADL